MTKQFTVEEINLMCIFDTSDKKKLMAELVGAMKTFDDEMLDIAVSVAYRLDDMSDAEFAALELCPVYDDYDESEV
jgi:hypothetical protein